MADSNENSLNAHLHNPDSNPTYIYMYECIFDISDIRNK